MSERVSECVREREREREERVRWGEGGCVARPEVELSLSRGLMPIRRRLLGEASRGLNCGACTLSPGMGTEFVIVLQVDEGQL